jgi:signal transduction histidine kinase
MRHAFTSVASARQVANGARYGALAALCHELRTPLNLIFGFAEMLDDPRFSVEERREFTQRIKTAGGDLLHAIERSLEDAERPLLGRGGLAGGERASRLRWSLHVHPNEQLPWVSPVRHGRPRQTS